MLSPDTGVTLRSFGVDWLHALPLGVFAHVLGHLTHALLDANIFSVSGSKAQRYEIGVAAIRESLFTWYRMEETAGRKHSRVQTFTVKMVGPAHMPFMKLHGVGK